ncbi:hypothetical protein [Legionella brunensis]|uniref:Protein-glutamine gamma-glutamyltransferase n=1 Tax=Legionella brunensis TaxID=29422 RepID=A0A0W0S3U4_9GAMM|nr:hypothetical protein [Legionella brunensis]KTC77899.1 Protein-glutamine gamma-glutamyltransferase [Legionella brunensis]
MILIFSYPPQRNIQVSKDFETTESLDKGLIELLQSIRKDHEERFNMLVGASQRIPFKDIEELKEDMQQFSRLKLYEKSFNGTAIMAELYTKNLTKIWGGSDLILQLEIRKLALTRQENNPLKQEIILKLCHSMRKFKSIERFDEEVAFRFNAVTLMDNDKFHRSNGGYRYPTAAENYLQLNSDYWEMPNKGHGFFTLKNGVEPADAINSIFDDSKLVVLECHSMMLCIQYKALLDTVGKDKFNLLFKEKPLIIADGFRLSEWYKEDLNEMLPYRSDTKRTEDLIPGDWLYLSNFPEYSAATLYDPSKDGSGLHSMAMGNNKYRGFGADKSMTHEEAKQYFLEVYNEDFCANPIALTEANIDSSTMGLDGEEEALEKGDEVVICGHIDCPVAAWARVNCVYEGNGRFSCETLQMKDASENEIVLALLEKYNSCLPKRKTEEDLKTLNIFSSLSTNVRSINFSSERFNAIFLEKPSMYSATSSALFTQITSTQLQTDLKEKEILSSIKT